MPRRSLWTPREIKDWIRSHRDLTDERIAGQLGIHRRKVEYYRLKCGIKRGPGGRPKAKPGRSVPSRASVAMEEGVAIQYKNPADWLDKNEIGRLRLFLMDCAPESRRRILAAARQGDPKAAQVLEERFHIRFVRVGDHAKRKADTSAPAALPSAAGTCQ